MLRNISKAVFSRRNTCRRGYSSAAKKDLIQSLQQRGLIYAITSENVQQIINDQQVSIYAGFDPTSDSLHAGNLLSIIMLTHFKNAGVKPIALVGGATGLIGDPSGKSEERQLLQEDTVQTNLNGISAVLQKCLGSDVKVVNNYDWYKDMSAIHFLRNVGKHFRIGSMLAKDSVKTRLSRTTDAGPEDNSGLSFTEFSYQILQAYDFYHLYQKENCKIQLGGSDQWGNITAGTELIRRRLQQEAYGITTPLLTTSSGKKFGKSEGNAIWLSDAKTSAYDFYQFFMRTEDSDVIKLLKYFTFLPLDRITEIEQEHSKKPESRLAQAILAAEVTKFVHGEQKLSSAEAATKLLFGGDLPLDKISEADLVAAVTSSGQQVIELARSEVLDKNLIDVFTTAKFGLSKSEIRRLFQAGGIYVNNKPVSKDAPLTDADVVNNMILLRTGKKNYRLVRVK
jgi:tyrosyl-tRNA synthetase